MNQRHYGWQSLPDATGVGNTEMSGNVDHPPTEAPTTIQCSPVEPVHFADPNSLTLPIVGPTTRQPTSVHQGTPPNRIGEWNEFEGVPIQCMLRQSSHAGRTGDHHRESSAPSRCPPTQCENDDYPHQAATSRRGQTVAKQHPPGTAGWNRETRSIPTADKAGTRSHWQTNDNRPNRLQSVLPRKR